MKRRVTSLLVALFVVVVCSSTAMAGMVWTYVDPSGEKFVVTKDFSDKDKKERGLKLVEASYAPPTPIPHPTQALRQKAEQGNAAAQFDLGTRYRNGDGVSKNLVEAVKWVRMAANQGDAEAQYNLGLAYYLGDGAPKNPAEAAKWWSLAAEKGMALAQFNLGAMYVNGDGVPKNLTEATKWLRMAAKQGNTEAQAALKQIDALPATIPQPTYSNSLNSAPDRAVPSQIVSQIEAKAKADFPNDYSVQLFQIKKEKAAYLDLESYTASDIPYDVLNKTRAKAAKDFQLDFSVQLFYIKKEVAAYRDLKTVSAPGVPYNILEEIKTKAKADFPDDYSVQLFVINKEAASYRQLNNR